MMQNARCEEQVECGRCGRPIARSHMSQHQKLAHTREGQEQTKAFGERFGVGGKGSKKHLVKKKIRITLW